MESVAKQRLNGVLLVNEREFTEIKDEAAHGSDAVPLRVSSERLMLFWGDLARQC